MRLKSHHRGYVSAKPRGKGTLLRWIFALILVAEVGCAQTYHQSVTTGMLRDDFTSEPTSHERGGTNKRPLMFAQCNACQTEVMQGKTGQAPVAECKPCQTPGRISAQAPKIFSTSFQTCEPASKAPGVVVTEKKTGDGDLVSQKALRMTETTEKKDTQTAAAKPSSPSITPAVVAASPEPKYLPPPKLGLVPIDDDAGKKQDVAIAAPLIPPPAPVAARLGAAYVDRPAQPQNSHQGGSDQPLIGPTPKLGGKDANDPFLVQIVEPEGGDLPAGSQRVFRLNDTPARMQVDEHGKIRVQILINGEIQIQNIPR